MYFFYGSEILAHSFELDFQEFANFEDFWGNLYIFMVFERCIPSPPIGLVGTEMKFLDGF